MRKAERVSGKNPDLMKREQDQTGRRKETGAGSRPARYVLVYSVCFLIIALLVYAPYYLNGKTLIWKEDGIPQHFNALLYYRDWLREIFYHLFYEHRLEIPLWDMHIGYGSDIINTLHYYVLGDPLTFLSVLVPRKEWMDEFYSLMVVFRLYLAGLTFSWFCFTFKNKPFPVLMGALLYVFSFWGILAAVRHPFFVNPLIYLPVVLIGVEKLFQKKKPGLFVGSLAVSICSNFYFAYMICLTVLIYCIFRYVMIFGKIKIRELLPWIGRFVVCVIVACGLASVLLLPSALCYFSTGRSQSVRQIPLFYPQMFYRYFLPAFLTNGAGYWNNMGYTAYGVVGIFLMFLQKKKYRAFKIAFVLWTGFMLLPYAGHVFNGFSYETNRFCWVMAMLAAYIFVKVWPDMMTLSGRKKKLLAAAVLVYTGACLIDEINRTEMLEAALITLVLLTASLVLKTDRGSRKFRKLFKLCHLAGLSFCLVLQAFYYYSPQEGNHIAVFADNNEALLSLTSSAQASVLNEVEDDTVWRYDSYGLSDVYNTSSQLKQNSVSYYWSLADGNIFQFQREMGLNLQKNYRYQNLDSRSFLDALASVKYFVIPAGTEQNLPYGFDHNVLTGQAGENGAEVSVYSTENWLPLGYTYDRWISRDEYERLSITEKQQALQQAVVLEDSSLAKADPVYEDQKAAVSETVGEGIEKEEGGIFVRKPGASITLSFSGIPECETYFVIEGLDFEGCRPSEQYTEEEWESLTRYEKNQIRRQEKDWTWPDSAVINVSDGTSSKNINYLNQRSGAYSDMHDYLVNTGYSPEAKNTITLTFLSAGHYKFDGYSIVCQPTASLGNYVSERKENVLEEVQMDVNRITGTIHVDEAKALLLSIPYSEGWTAWVDGTKAELKQANTMYMALELEEGTHQIVLRYQTPGWKIGMVISSVSLAVCAGWMLFSGIHRKNRKMKEKKPSGRSGEEND